jgi:hypothetical protein
LGLQVGDHPGPPRMGGGVEGVEERFGGV